MFFAPLHSLQCFVVDKNNGEKGPKLGNFSNDDGDGYENVKTATGLLNETSSLHVHHAFLYISSPSLRDYDLKIPNCKFYGGRKRAKTNFCFPL